MLVGECHALTVGAPSCCMCSWKPCDRAHILMARRRYVEHEYVSAYWLWSAPSYSMDILLCRLKYLWTTDETDTYFFGKPITYIQHVVQVQKTLAKVFFYLFQTFRYRLRIWEHSPSLQYSMYTSLVLPQIVNTLKNLLALCAHLWSFACVLHTNMSRYIGFSHGFKTNGTFSFQSWNSKKTQIIFT